MASHALEQFLFLHIHYYHPLSSSFVSDPRLSSKETSLFQTQRILKHYNVNRLYEIHHQPLAIYNPPLPSALLYLNASNIHTLISLHVFYLASASLPPAPPQITRILHSRPLHSPQSTSSTMAIHSNPHTILKPDQCVTIGAIRPPFNPNPEPQPRPRPRPEDDQIGRTCAFFKAGGGGGKGGSGRPEDDGVGRSCMFLRRSGGGGKGRPEDDGVGRR